MSNQNVIIGIDCGATKVMAQSALFDAETGLVSPGEFHREINYANHPNWNSNFIPVHLDIQRQEFSEGTINLTEPEMDQGDVIVETIQDVLLNPSFVPPFKNGDAEGFNKKIALCFPGIKNKHGVVIMANGPRIPELYSRIEIEQAYHDSDCCVLGEWQSTIGQLTTCKNAIYIGGGTGIADGIILNDEIIDFNKRDDVKRSWELIMDSGQSVESLLSPKGILTHWNSSQSNQVNTLTELLSLKIASPFLEQIADTFSFLIENRCQFFQKQNAMIEKIVIGQRLGIALEQSESPLRHLIEEKTSIPIVYSMDRRTAALGAAWKKACS